MKILMLSGNVFLPIAPFNKSKNGFGYTVGGICQNLALEHSVYLLTQSAFTDGQDLGNLHIVPKKAVNILQGFSWEYLVQWWKETKHISFFSQMKYRTLAYYLTGKYVEKQIQRIQPDTVHIAGVHHPTSCFIRACENKGVPYIVSLHGLNSFNPELHPSVDLVAMERDFLQKMGDKPVAVVSSGVKKRIEQYLGREMPNIRVISDGISPIEWEETLSRKDFLEKLGIPEDSYVLISVSNINQNKNQMQVLEAMRLLPEEVREKTYYLICGVGEYEDRIRVRAKELNMQDHVKICGYINNREIWKYYSVSDVNLMVSHSEGFGRSVVEGYMCGIPTVIFSDLDACEDLACEQATVVVHDRTDEALMKGILQALQTQWDKAAIQAFSTGFTGTEMGNKYGRFHEWVLKNTEH